MTAPPVVLLDVDGVLNTFQPSWGADLVKVNVAGLTIRYAPAMIERLHQVLAGAEVRWCTTWCNLTPQIARLNEILGFDFPCAFGDRSMSKTWGDLKVEAALSVLAEGRRLVWADDEEAAAGRRLFPEIARAERAGRALLITPDSVVGLQPEDLDLIEAFLKEAACCDSHNRHCEPPGDLCCADCPEAAHDMFPIRHGDGSRCVLEDQ